MARPKQSELPVEGPGVSVPRIAAIDRLADELEDLLDQKGELATKAGGIEKKLIEKMEENKITKYKYRDRLVVYKPGKIHVKLKTVKVEGADAKKGGDDEPPTA